MEVTDAYIDQDLLKLDILLDHFCIISQTHITYTCSTFSLASTAVIGLLEPLFT